MSIPAVFAREINSLLQFDKRTIEEIKKALPDREIEKISATLDRMKARGEIRLEGKRWSNVDPADWPASAAG